MSEPLLTTRDLTTAVGGPFELDVFAGQCLTIMGPSGVGKSLLLRALADLDPHGGEVWLQGARQSQTPPALWRRRVLYVPAAAGWWADTVSEHVAEIGKHINDLRALGLPLDCGDWPVTRLSSGEKQRLALLRAVTLTPQVLLLDEPTANLDADSGLAIEAWLAACKNRGTALVWVTHDAVQAERVADVRWGLDAHGLKRI